MDGPSRSCDGLITRYILEMKKSIDRVSDEGLPPVDLAVQRQLRMKLQQAQTADHYYFIDIVGTCNLRCPSCPVGNVVSETPKGFMALGRLREILTKIATHQHAGKRIFIDLYNWGEPTLHPDLAGCVHLVHEFGFRCGISSNLNVFPKMREVVKSAPEYIRVSLSGFYNDSYQLTHKGGDINAVKGNMFLLRHCMDRYKVDMVVQVGFHVYRSNFPRDFLKMRELCDDLGFIFAPVIATMMPAEKAVAATDRNICSSDLEIHKKFVIPLERWSELYRNDGVQLSDCQFRQARTTINYDGSVSLCCAVYEPDKIVAKNFLDTDEGSLKRAKYSHSFCETCMSRSMHMMYTGVSSNGLMQEAATVLGPLYKKYQEEEAHLTDPDLIVWDGQFRTIQDVYDEGVQALGIGKDGLLDADRHFTALARQAPTFGEGLFQAARVAEQLGEQQRALFLMAEAARLAPDLTLYRTEFERLYAMEVGHPPGVLLIYENGMKALQLGPQGLDTAEAYFQELIRCAPTFGEGFFQAARVADQRGDRQRAKTLMAQAVRLAPHHPLYQDELKRLELGLVQ